MAARPRIVIPEDRRVPEKRIDQLNWDVRKHVPLRDRPNLAFDHLPPEVQRWFRPEGGSGGSGLGERGPMPPFPADKSIICSDKEWRRYWERQGILDAVCDTSTVLADILRKLRVSVQSGHASLCRCEKLRDRVTLLYDEKATLARALRRYQHEQVRLRERVELLRRHLKNIAHEIQRSYPHDAVKKRGLSGGLEDWSENQWMQLFPHLHESVRKIIRELADCNSKLRGTDGQPGIDIEIDSLKAELAQVKSKVKQLQDELTEANGKLRQARLIIAALVKQAAAMGYSLRAIDESVSENGDEKGVKAFLEGLKRYEYNAPPVPDDVDPIDIDEITAQMDAIQLEMEGIKAKCKGEGTAKPPENYPFPNPNEWYDLIAKTLAANMAP